MQEVGARLGEEHDRPRRLQLGGEQPSLAAFAPPIFAPSDFPDLTEIGPGLNFQVPIAKISLRRE